MISHKVSRIHLDSWWHRSAARRSKKCLRSCFSQSSAHSQQCRKCSNGSI